MESKVICHECGGEMVLDTRSSELIYKGRVASMMQTGWYCQGCGGVLLDGDGVNARAAVFMRLKADVDGLLLPQEITRIRRKLGLSQRKASELLGGGPRSFQKYESGTDWITRSMANLLRLLDNDPTRLGELIPRTKP